VSVSPSDLATIDALARDLRSADFTVDSLTRLWGADAASALHRGHRVPALRALAGDDGALATLARAFVLGLPVRPDALARALPSTGLASAVRLGLVDESAAPLVDLRPYSFVDGRGVVSWWIVSDLGELALGHAIPEDHVLGVGGASSTLTGLMMSTRVARALDLGTGCGIQALHLARHAEHVVATDISQRALRLAAVNAALNGVDTIEFRLGSLFEPVAGERFDHIVSNPPFVITPRGAAVPDYDYRDGGMIGDALVRTVITGLERHLEPGGVAQLLGNWEYTSSQGLDRVRQWVRTTNLDAWVIEREVQTVDEYAETWIRDGGTRPGLEFDRLYAAWLDDFASRSVTQVGFGFVILRKPVSGGPTLRRFEHIDTPIAGPLGERIAQSLADHDRLAAADLLRAALELASDVTEERHYWPGEEHPTVITLVQGSGFGRRVPAGTALAAVVGACDGSLTVGAICAAVAELLEVDERELLGEVVPQLSELVFTGMLRISAGPAR
jgi:methylase of polypeptide subunit release factors